MRKMGITVKKAAQILGITTMSVYRYIKAGKIKVLEKKPEMLLNEIDIYNLREVRRK